jgi:hypothetical protein
MREQLIFHFLLIFFFVPSRLLLAESTCRADIFYVVEACPVTPKEEDKGDRKGDKTPKERVFYLTLSVKEASAEEAKSALEQRVEFAKSRAKETCKRLNQVGGECISRRLLKSVSLLQGADFISRKEIIDGIKKECEALCRICLGAESATPVCVEEVVKAEAPKGEGDSKGKKEGDKGKEKGKK